MLTTMDWMIGTYLRRSSAIDPRATPSDCPLRWSVVGGGAPHCPTRPDQAQRGRSAAVGRCQDGAWLTCRPAAYSAGRGSRRCQSATPDGVPSAWGDVWVANPPSWWLNKFR